ncbi:hypothetical protein [Phocicoccus pinnipedialis]|uniref:Uncharacterized protein n=1 Tax=Phocicoccus pinnipedialis TaxID=110845 RepID=A0A6V7RHA6_9BACL|nr:hypothetical protein [Jeotgalicoccus pinnipedialis]MBP1939175.1 hypothetical protein [Jeotgalicoccus pinnipedialis]CAD2076442.1 hypothetical protein JEOPIN946_01263 [Jeotgalicoccus pinnipedialis]
MTKQEQLTVTTIALFMLLLSIYLYIDFYFTGNTHSVESLSGMTQMFGMNNEQIQNIDSEVTVKILSQVTGK